MRWVKLFLVWIAACLMLGSTATASVSVSPVVIEGVEAEVGQVFEVLCHNGGEEAVAVDLSLALFDQDDTGRVVLLEDAEAIAKAAHYLNVITQDLSLEAMEQRMIQVELMRDDFDSLYAVLFVKPRQEGVQARLAVLFLLSTVGSGIQADMAISTLVKPREALTLTVENKGISHSPWEGELHFFDAFDYLCEKRQVTSGLVLPGRSRGLQVSLPPWVHRVEVRTAR